MLDNLYDLDLNLFSKNIRNLDPCISADDFYNFLEKQVPGFLSILYLNIQTIRYISKNFKSFLCSLDFAFGIMFFRQHGLMIYVILYMICLNTKIIIKKGVIAKAGQYLSIFITLLISKLNLTLIVNMPNQLPYKKNKKEKYKTSRDDIENNKSSNEAYNFFLLKFIFYTISIFQKKCKNNSKKFMKALDNQRNKKIFKTSAKIIFKIPKK